MTKELQILPSKLAELQAGDWLSTLSYRVEERSLDNLNKCDVVGMNTRADMRGLMHRWEDVREVMVIAAHTLTDLMNPSNEQIVRVPRYRVPHIIFETDEDAMFFKLKTGGAA